MASPDHKEHSEESGMTRKRRKSGKHRPVIATKPAKEISQEIEMQELKKVFRRYQKTCTKWALETNNASIEVSEWS
jgi:hypothetical protein